MANDVILDLGNEYIGSAYSPVVEITENEDGHTISITSADPDAAGHLVTQSFDVSNYADEEEGREAAETARAAAESQRAAAESEREAHEDARQSAESERASAESARDAAETERASAESARADAESARANAEQGRASAESARVAAEQARAAAETAREIASATAVHDAEVATDAAQSATTAAQSATSAATTATTNANTATAAANTATANAQSATSAAQAAANDANTAAESASEFLENNVVPKLVGTITPSNYSTLLPTFNADFSTCVYSFSGFGYGSAWPTGGPYATYKGIGGSSVLVNLKQPSSTIIEQIFIDGYGIWVRFINPATSSYNNWSASTKSNIYIDASNYGSRLSSVKNSDPFTNYILNFSAGSTSIPSDLPTSYWEGGIGTLMCVDDYYKIFTSYLFTVAGKAYIRTYNHNTGTFVSRWRQIGGESALYVSKNQTGTGFYSNFTQACLDAYNEPYAHPTVYVLDGSYDVGAELDEMLGGLDTLTESSAHAFKYGIALGGYDIVCSGNASMYFHYTGDNEYILNMLSMFDVKKNNGSDPSFKIVGMHASGSRTRYLIHDDTSGDNRRNRVPIHEYKDCTLEFDNRNNEHRVGAQVIGGGLGMATVVDISGCVFIQHDTSVTGTVTYHNNYYAGSQSQVNITGCYFTSGGIIFGYYGSSTLQTICRVSNCSLTYGPAKREEVAGSTDNMTLYAWNNEVRS